MSSLERVIGMGASAGGIQAVKSILGALPEDMAAAVLVVIHTSSESPGLLPAILQRGARIAVVSAQDGEQLQAGTAYIAPPGHDLILSDDVIKLTRGPFENRVRPAIDPTFRSVAKAFGPRGIGVVLTGYLDDGTAGLASIKRHGGRAIVQDPDDAEVPGMPRSAIANVQVDAVAPLPRIAQILLDYIEEIVAPVPRGMEEASMNHDQATPSVYTCPECHGTLWEVQDGPMLRFECRVGHAYSMESMVEEQNDSTERAIWAALRSLEESAQLSRRLMKRAQTGGQALAVQRFENRAQQAEEHVRVLRRLMDRVEPLDAHAKTGSRTSLI